MGAVLGMASAAITSGRPKEAGSRKQDAGQAHNVGFHGASARLGGCVQDPGALGTGGVDLERDTSRASSISSSSSSSSNSSNKCQPKNYCIIRIRIMLGSNEMMWRRIVDLWCRKETSKRSKPNTSPPSDRPRSGYELV